MMKMKKRGVGRGRVEGERNEGGEERGPEEGR